MKTTEMTVGELYSVVLRDTDIVLPRGLSSRVLVRLIFRYEDWCLVRTWDGKIYSVPTGCLSLD